MVRELLAVLVGLGVSGPIAGIARAQDTTDATAAPIPSAYQAVYTELSTSLNNFASTINSQWNGVPVKVDYSGELTSANANLGLQLLGKYTQIGVMMEAQRLQQLGVKAVTLSIGFPMLYQPFFQFNGDPNDYSALLTFYKQLVVQLHKAGLKVVVESGDLFPGFSTANSGLNLTGYYSSLTTTQYVTGRATVAATIAAQIQPDYLSVGAEPDVEAQFSKVSYAAEINAIVTAVKATGATMPVGAGIGTWEANGQSYIQSLAGTGIDFVDLHVYPVVQNFLQNLVTLASTAQSLGKKVAITEAWLLKEGSTEFKTFTSGSSVIFARDAYSFFAPLDQQFLTLMVKFANWKQLMFVSPFWTRYFYGYLDYNQVQSLTPNQVYTAMTNLEVQGVVNGTFSATGLAYQSAIANPAK